MHQDRLQYSQQKMLFKEELFCIDQDTEIKKKLHASIAALAYRTKDRLNGCGSAVLLSKNLVLTSASNIYSKQDGYVYLSFKLYIAASGIAQKYYEIQSWRYLKDFQTCLDSTRLQYDYALLKLKQEVSLPDSKNFLTVSLPCQICMANKKQHIVLDVYGYPKYKENYRPADKWASKLFLKQYGLSRKDKIIAISSEKCKLQYAVSTEIGHGGCPIATEDSVIAIHVGSGRGESQYNIGRLFTTELIKNLIKWGKQMNGHPISIDQKNICPHLENNQLFKSNSLVKNTAISAVNVLQEEKEMQIGPMQIKGVYFFEVADAVRKMSAYKRSRVSELTVQITVKMSRCRVEGMIHRCSERLTQGTLESMQTQRFADSVCKEIVIKGTLCVISKPVLMKKQQGDDQERKATPTKCSYETIQSVLYGISSRYIVPESAVKPSIFSSYLLPLNAEYNPINKECTGQIIQWQLLANKGQKLCHSASISQSTQLYSSSYQAQRNIQPSRKQGPMKKCNKSTRKGFQMFHSGQNSINAVVQQQLSQEQLAKHIQKFVILRKLTIYARFALYNTEEFHKLRESLAKLPLEMIELIIDPSYEKNSEKDNWTEGEIGEKRAKMEVSYVKWSQL